MQPTPRRTVSSGSPRSGLNPYIVRAKTSSGFYSPQQLQPHDVGVKALEYLLSLPGAVPGAVLQVTENGVEWVPPPAPEPEPDEFLGDVKTIPETEQL